MDIFLFKNGEHGTVMDQYKNVPRHIFLTAIIG
jgi:hypothetical protein